MTDKQQLITHLRMMKAATQTMLTNLKDKMSEEISMELKQILTDFLGAKSSDEIQAASNQLNDFDQTANDAEKEVIQAAVNAKAKLMINEAKELLTESQAYLATKGKLLDLNEWLTLKAYCQRFGITSTNVVSNWIKRGIVPAENLMNVPELNDLKLIRAVKYL